MKKPKKKVRIIKKILLNILAGLMMLSGPFLMWLPGPQVISWTGAVLFLFLNVDFINNHIYKFPWRVQYWFYWLVAHGDKFKRDWRTMRIKYRWF